MSALAFNGSSTLLASAQEGPLGVLRLWDFPKGSCLAVFQTHLRAVLSLRYVPALEGMHLSPGAARKADFPLCVFFPKFEPYHQAALVFRTCNCKWQVLQRGSFSMLLLRDKAGVNYSSPSAACVSQQVCWQLTPQHSPSPAFACFDSQLRCVGGVRCSPSPGVPPVLAASPTAEPFSVALERTGMAKR